MAIEQNEIKKVISVDLGNSGTTLKEYKKHIDDLRASLLHLDESSEEYGKIAKEIKAEQDKLNDVMRVGKKDTDAAEGSYNHLTQTMAELKKQWKATADETERAELGEKILGINNQLKELDASTGNFQRNVGDYRGAMLDAFQSLPGPIGKVTTGLKGVGVQLKALLAHPIVAIVAAISAAIMALTKSIRGNEEQMMQLREAFAVFEPVINLVKNAITKFAQGVVDVFTKVSDTVTTFIGWIGRQARNLGFDEFADKIEKFQEMQKESKEMAAEENKLIKENRQLNVDISKTQTKISELKLKANQADKYSQEERQKFLKEADKLEIENAEKKIQLRQREYELIKWKNEQSQNATKDYEAEDQALMAVNEAQTDLNNKLAGTARRIASLSSQMKSDVKETQALIQQTYIDIEGIKMLPSSEELSLSLDTLKGIYKGKVAQMNEEFDHEGTMLKLTGDTKDPEQLEQELFELGQRRIRAQMNLNMELLANEQLTADERKRILMEQDELSAQLAQNDRERNKELAEDNIKEAEKEAKVREALQKQILSSAASLFGSLADMSEENSEAQKAFSVMETIINTLASIPAIWKGYSSLGPWGLPAAIAQTAAVTATGIATIAKIKSTTKSSSSVDVPQATVSPQATMTSVTPLLDEQADLNKLESNNVQQSIDTKVYVVESDIREVGQRVDVRETNATF